MFAFGDDGPDSSSPDDGYGEPTADSSSLGLVVANTSFKSSPRKLDDFDFVNDKDADESDLTMALSPRDLGMASLRFMLLRPPVSRDDAEDAAAPIGNETLALDNSPFRIVFGGGGLTEIFRSSSPRAPLALDAASSSSLSRMVLIVCDLDKLALGVFFKVGVFEDTDWETVRVDVDVGELAAADGSELSVTSS